RRVRRCARRLGGHRRARLFGRCPEGSRHGRCRGLHRGRVRRRCDADCRGNRSAVMLTDFRYALRTLVRSPGFALTAAATLAIGIGANTAIFTVVYALLLKPLPFRDADRLIYVHDTYPAVANASVSLAKFLALRDGNRSLTSLAATAPGSLTM